MFSERIFDQAPETLFSIFLREKSNWNRINDRNKSNWGQWKRRLRKLVARRTEPEQLLFSLETYGQVKGN